jgi:pilus assembly protein Flp/PilA
MTSRFKAFRANRSGATAIEYALIAALIALSIVAALLTLPSHLNHIFNEVSTNLS